LRRDITYILLFFLSAIAFFPSYGQKQQVPSGYKEWVEAFDVIAELKLANGRIPRKPDAPKFLNHTLLEKLYEDSK